MNRTALEKELLEALEVARPYVYCPDECLFSNGQENCDVLNKIDAAISHATAPQPSPTLDIAEAEDGCPVCGVNDGRLHAPSCRYVTLTCAGYDDEPIPDPLTIAPLEPCVDVGKA